MKYFIITLVLSITNFAKAQQNKFYDDAFQTINNMLADKQAYSFKTAVLSVEDAYYQGKLDTVEVNRKIKFMANFAKKL
ncbi:hypothetical protein [Chryseobacterium sp. CH1]|uniref:hypothetical protein n=1 Tax=Chryseobacterium sp. CH1 TaxID=713551 RepID=UPI001E4A44CC|nr:hypothetical protein [Chryseobacterium sp. CH1]